MNKLSYDDQLIKSCNALCHYEHVLSAQPVSFSFLIPLLSTCSNNNAHGVCIHAPGLIRLSICCIITAPSRLQGQIQEFFQGGVQD